MSGTGPPVPTGPHSNPNTNLAALRDQLRLLDDRIKLLERNRQPVPTLMHQLDNTARMNYAQLGHAPVYSSNTGDYVPSPVLASMMFHLPGPIAVATSDPQHARYLCNVLAVSADFGTWGGGTTFVVYKNGSPIATVTPGSQSTGLIAVSGTPILVPYTDLITVATTAAGAGDSGLVVHVELGLVAANEPGPQSL